MRVLITGGTGFLGRHAHAALRSLGVESIICGRTKQASVPLPAGAYVQCNLLSEKTVFSLCTRLRPTHILHLAWCTNSSGEYWNSPENLCWLEASQRLMRAFATTGGYRFVGVGTGVEYSAIATPRDEIYTPTAPDSLYGKAKLACANALMAHAEALSFSAAWCRPFYLLGPGESLHRLIPSASRALQRGKTFYCLDGERTFDYLDARDAALAMAMLLFSDVSGVVNIASGSGIQVRELLTLLAQVNDVPPNFTYGKALANTPPVIAAVKRLHMELGFRPRFSLAQSLVDCYNDMEEKNASD